MMQQQYKNFKIFRILPNHKKDNDNIDDDKKLIFDIRLENFGLWHYYPFSIIRPSISLFIVVNRGIVVVDVVVVVVEVVIIIIIIVVIRQLNLFGRYRTFVIPSDRIPAYKARTDR
jgi:hypothetical protein